MTSPSPLAVTLGDPAGIGPEIVLKAWRALRDTGPAFAVFADPDQLQSAAEQLDCPRPEPMGEMAGVREAFQDVPPVVPLAKAASEPGAALASIEAAVAAALEGSAGGVVTAPVSKARLYDEGFAFPGHTEFIAHLTAHAPMVGARGPVMMLAGPDLRTALVTIHLSLRDALDRLSVEAIVHAGQVTAQALKRDFNLVNPRLAVAGLNPHAGENGALGREEIEIVAPAIARLQALGVDAVGPMPPDTMFHAEARSGYDAALCLYHDQGLIPVKTLDFHGGVNVTLGLPVIRTSPDHGTAFDIAGQGVARADSLIAAITLADRMARCRAMEAGA